ncbi:butyrophilin subfamily 3 member A2-like [Scomber scombrus]|uniref:butyrophilin subfamily 3 member A2-like n=1 Tax=Scomber scombrus TaxID=13677 RepID=UPI002DD8A606|nr:butyrophilin subfamily 3 member A2-like [Scomber scombrus]
MLDMKDRLFLKPKLCDLGALVLHHTVVLLLLTYSCRGQQHLIGPTQPIVAMVGDDMVLPCYLEPCVDASAMTVEWERSDLKQIIYLMRDNVEIPIEQNSLYESRTSLSTNKLKCGDISLKLSKVKLSDAGTYKCVIPNLDTSVAEVIVGSVSTPDITTSIVSNGVTLECKSGSWYPEPEVLWLDGEGNLLSAGPTETVKGPDGLYTVSSRVTVEKSHSNRFTCRVQQNNINQTTETHVNVPDDFFLVPADSAVRVIICLVVCFMSIAAAVVVMWKWGLNNQKGSKHGIPPIPELELQLLMEGQQEGDLTRAEKVVNKKKGKHDEVLQSNTEDLKHVEGVITTLTEQKKDLKEQREKLISQLQEVKTKLKEIKKKVVEKAIVDPKKKEKKRIKINEELEQRKKELEELLKNIEKLLETTEDLIIRMTERKGKLENEREQIEKQQKEIETQREEIQRKLQSEKEEKAEEKGIELPKGDE